MIRTRFHSVLEERVNKAVDSLATSLAEGDAADYNQYSLKVGEIAGLKEALRIADEISNEDQ